MAFVQGLDVSEFDPVVNWAKIRAQGFRFVIIRSSYGVDNNQTIMDAMFPSHWAGAKAAGLLRGAYHYLKAAQDGARQATRFLEIVNWQKGDLPPALDLEELFNQGASNKQFITNAEAFLKKVKSELGVTPMIYSRASFLQEKLSMPNGKAPQWAGDYLMWISHWTFAFGDNIRPLEMPGWQPYTFWQYSGERDTLDGMTDTLGRPVKVDFNVFRETVEELFALANAAPPVAMTYTVQPGDTLENIARQSNVSLAELVRANPQILTAGMQLTVPQPEGTGGGEDIVTDTDTDTDHSTGGVPITYVVKPGDTLSAIASQFNTSINAIADANHIANPNLISVGQVLTIPTV